MDFAKEFPDLKDDCPPREAMSPVKNVHCSSDPSIRFLFASSLFLWRGWLELSPWCLFGKEPSPIVLTIIPDCPAASLICLLLAQSPVEERTRPPRDPSPLRLCRKKASPPALTIVPSMIFEPYLPPEFPSGVGAVVGTVSAGGDGTSFGFECSSTALLSPVVPNSFSSSFMVALLAFCPSSPGIASLLLACRGVRDKLPRDGTEQTAVDPPSGVANAGELGVGEVGSDDSPSRARGPSTDPRSLSPLPPSHRSFFFCLFLTLLIILACSSASSPMLFASW
mmetsp:Transcript_63013/g.186107  ORF Transcript_63013/g.186107 Transcript_63013/m.186107 type:complete len:281 (-) Transcript_63013:960-1802(-)